jgi:hypothetical protein
VGSSLSFLGLFDLMFFDDLLFVAVAIFVDDCTGEGRYVRNSWLVRGRNGDVVLFSIG